MVRYRRKVNLRKAFYLTYHRKMMTNFGVNALPVIRACVDNFRKVMTDAMNSFINNPVVKKYAETIRREADNAYTICNSRQSNLSDISQDQRSNGKRVI